MSSTNSCEDHDFKEKIAKEWENKEVSLPLKNFALLLFYQGVLPLFPIIFLFVGYFFLWDFYLSYWYVFIIVSPLFFLLIYSLYFVFLVEFSRILVKYWCDKKSPQEEGEFNRNFSNGDIEDLRLQYYHIRGFLYKWPTFLAKKSFFPWFQNYVLNRLADNKLHKNCYYGDCFVGLELIEIGDNSIIQEGSIISSHLIDSIFGSLTIKKIKIGDSCIIHHNGGFAPGVVTGNNLSTLPFTFMKKGRTISSHENNYYSGIPAAPFEMEDIAIEFDRYKKKELI